MIVSLYFLRLISSFFRVSVIRLWLSFLRQRFAESIPVQVFYRFCVVPEQRRLERLRILPSPAALQPTIDLSTASHVQSVDCQVEVICSQVEAR